MSRRERTTRRPWARQWSRLINIREGSGSLVKATTVDYVMTGSRFPTTGHNYQFLRADIYFSRSETKVVSLEVSEANRTAWIHHASESNLRRLTIEADNDCWPIQRFNPLRLNISVATTGYAWWKILTVEI